MDSKSNFVTTQQGIWSKWLSLKSLCLQRFKPRRRGEIQIEIHLKFSDSNLVSHLHFPLCGSDLSKANETWKKVKAAKRQCHKSLWAVHHWFSVFMDFWAFSCLALWWSRNHEAMSVQSVPCELPPGTFSKFSFPNSSTWWLVESWQKKLKLLGALEW